MALRLRWKLSAALGHASIEQQQHADELVLLLDKLQLGLWLQLIGCALNETVTCLAVRI